MAIGWLLRRTEVWPRTVDEVSLRAEAAADPLAAAPLDGAALRALAASRGVDHATAVLDVALRRVHAPFLREVDALEVDPSRLPRLRGTVLVVPAAFHEELPGLGGDGLLAAEVARAFGLASDRVPIASTGSVTGNADLVAARLRLEPARSVVLVTLSKGGADARIALERHPEAAAALAAWVQVCGLVRGTPLVDQLLAAPAVKRLVARLFLRAVGVSWPTLLELSSLRGPLSGPPRLPDGPVIVNVVGLPLASHLRGRALARHAALAPLGPNDGSTLALDAMLGVGHVYPVWGADHFLRVPEASALLYRLFLWLASRGILSPA